MPRITWSHPIHSDLSHRGYALVRGADLDVDASARAAAAALADEWNRLEPDRYLKNGATFRERRYARFRYLPRTRSIQLLAHRPYFQSTEANRYAGGIRREVAPLTRASLGNDLFNELIRFDFSQFPVDEAGLDHPWEVACHQFRTRATPREAGEPTPEGIHRDEIDFGAIHLMDRVNTRGGDSRVHSESGELLAEFRLEDPLDTMFWADRDVLHSVTPTAPVDPARNATRDILILGYTCSPGLRASD
ncbi:2OG-Fe dioxygenase family protein [Streptomyces sp. NBC_01077]|uniref:2OG-Fe dioxygenase family protein n=1 Tax=Streptomyces sp. NBC_01077 TaxID=2903746 RepID=UPI003866B6A8|nr:2OG-Fe dioxygenase family protein [Streptomyces sp. NBC_01077]